jgi:hypothetical protein
MLGIGNIKIYGRRNFVLKPFMTFSYYYSETISIIMSETMVTHFHQPLDDI